MSVERALRSPGVRMSATISPALLRLRSGILSDALEASWPAIARPNQLPPPGDWQVWLLLAGRGFGKTRTLAEWVCQQAASGRAGRIALLAPTAADARDVLVEGQSGMDGVAVRPPDQLSYSGRSRGAGSEREYSRPEGCAEVGATA